LAASGARLWRRYSHAERLELLKRHREQVRRAIASQRECLKLLDAKVSSYEGRPAEAPAPSQP